MSKRKRSDDDDEFQMDDDYMDEEEYDDDDDFVQEKFEEPASVTEDDEEDEPPKKKAKKTSTKKSTKKETKKKTTKTTKEKKGKEKKTTTTKKKTATKSKPKAIKDIDKVGEMLLEYLTSNNRPYAVQNLTVSFKGQFTKTTATKALDKLEEDGKVSTKSCGKTKLYYVNQSTMETVSPEELAQMDNEIKELAAEKKELSEIVRNLQRELSKIEKSMTNEELKAEIEKKKEIIAKRKEKLHVIESGQNLIDESEKKKVDEELEKYLKIWRKRKRIGTDIINAICEGRGCKPSQLIEELDLITDDAEGVDINQIGKLQD